MGLFENLGRKVGQFTHEAKRAAAEETTDTCENCGERFSTEQPACPNCEETAPDRERASSAADRTESTADTDAAERETDATERE